MFDEKLFFQTTVCSSQIVQFVPAIFGICHISFKKTNRNFLRHFFEMTSRRSCADHVVGNVPRGLGK